MTYYYSSLIVLVFLSCVSVKASNKRANLTDQRACKLTHIGSGFTGAITKTESGIHCQSWATKDPINKISPSIVDTLFPDGSKGRAKNYCRNPTRNINGPWCYTIDIKVSDEICGIPLCSYSSCRISGPGAEYSGQMKQTSTGEECLKWNKKYKIKADEKASKFKDKQFPDNSRKTAKNFCRNPDGDTGGPWCFVERDVEGGKDIIMKQLCDIPFCDDPDCTFYSSASRGPVPVIHSHFTALNSSLGNLTFGLKLWDPDDWSPVKVYVLLSAVATPTSGKKGEKWGENIELVVSNGETGATAGAKDSDLNATPMIVVGNLWSWFYVKWANGFITVTRQGSVKPLYIGEYEDENAVEFSENDPEQDAKNGPFRYYSLEGDRVMWSVPSCQTGCDEHVTSRTDFVRFWPVNSSSTGNDVSIYVRGLHTVILELRTTPIVKYPNIRVTFQNIKNMTSVTYQAGADTGRMTLKEVRTEGLLEYWEWREFSVSVFGKKLNIFWTRDVGTHSVLDVEDDRLRGYRWFSPGSDLTVAHWTFFCKPVDLAIIKLALPPECATSKSEIGYQGSQWSSNTGLPCIPWVDKEYIPGDVGDTSLVDGTKKAARNYCRNPSKDPGGPYCYAVDVDHDGAVTKQYCTMRKCRTAECRMAGTGNDYIGTLSRTRSNRTCQRWQDNKPHVVKKDYLNVTLFADGDVKKADNFCRDPSRNIAGSWCYTTDPAVEADACDVRDCVRPEECTVMTRGVGIGRLVYILPAWRNHGIQFWLKEWDPELTDGIIFELRPKEGKRYYKLIVGADDNEKVKFYYANENGELKLIKEKSLPHLIPIGKWGGFWLKMPHGKIRLGYIGVESHLFQWTHDKEEELFHPAYLTYISIVGNTIGVSFLCNECHIENTSTDRYTKILPIGLWSKELGGNYNNLTLYLRGTGIAMIPLMKLPGLGKYYALTIGDLVDAIFFVKQTAGQVTTLNRVRTKRRLIVKDKWSKFFIAFNETFISVARDGEVLLNYTHTGEPLMFYWFSLGVEKGYVIWSANCQPADIDGDPVNGDWSDWGPWSCSVTCGGGVGIQRRVCNNPEPNIYGEDCDGSDTLEGKCNEFPCGELSPDTIEILVNRLQTEHFGYQPLEGDRVIMDMDKEIFKIIIRESPEATWQWTKNGHPLNLTDDRILLMNDTIHITHANPSDNGVYACVLTRISKQRMVLRVISLAVLPKSYTLKTRISYEETVWCNGIVLGYVYNDLSEKWLIDDVMWKDYGVTTMEAVNHEKIGPMTKRHEGVWKCVVSQRDLGFTWVTNIVDVRVFPAPTFLTHLMEDEISAPLFRHFGNERYVGVFLICVFVFTIVGAIFGVYAYLKWFRLPGISERAT